MLGLLMVALTECESGWRRGGWPCRGELCVECQSERDWWFEVRGGFNRRGSKDSQLR